MLDAAEKSLECVYVLGSMMAVSDVLGCLERLLARVKGIMNTTETAVALLLCAKLLHGAVLEREKPGAERRREVIHQTSTQDANRGRSSINLLQRDGSAYCHPLGMSDRIQQSAEDFVKCIKSSGVMHLRSPTVVVWLRETVHRLIELMGRHHRCLSVNASHDSISD